MLDGLAEHWARTLARWTEDLGFGTYMYWPTTDHADQLDRFAHEVVQRA